MFLVDAYALIYRSYFAFIRNPLTNAAGENTSAAWGVANFLITILEDYDPEYMAVVFDAGRSHREELFPEYKATREKMPDDLAEGLPRIRELVEAFHGPVVSIDGFEADDVIGTLAARAKAEGMEAVIVSGDKDFYQLLEPGVALLNPGRGGPQGVDAEWVEADQADAKFGVPADRIIDYLALVGDSSDNVPGAPGVGPKTAVKLLTEFGSLDALLERAGEVKAKRAREALQDHADQIRLSRQLVTISTDLDVDVTWSDLQVTEPDRDRLRAVLLHLEFRTLIDKLELGASVEEPAAATRTDVVHQMADVERLVDRVYEAGRVAVTTVSGGERAVQGKLAGLGLAIVDDPDTGDVRAWYLPLLHYSGAELTLDLLGPAPGDDGAIPSLPSLADPAMARLCAMLQDADVAKVGHDLKEALIALEAEGVALQGIETDVMVTSYVLDPGRRSHALRDLSLDVLGESLAPRKDVVGSGKSEVPFHETDPSTAGVWVCLRAAAALQLASRLGPKLEAQGLDELTRTLELPLVPVLAAMERRGIAIDAGFFRTMGARLESELARLEGEIQQEAGREFNLKSTPQLREVLFDDLELPVIKKTKTGPSTDVSVLEELAMMGHAVPRLLIEYRQLEKLRSTYVDALPRLVHPRTGRIHTSLNQAVAQTGRLSSSDPNLQNIPIRTELGREIRKGFVARDGWRFLGVDYSQIELRILAHFSGDPAFVTAFREGIDVHKQTASVIFSVPIDEVTPEMRGQAKTINFATLYGQGDFSLAKQLGISRDEAREFIDGYFERFAGVRRYLDSQVEQAQEQGFVETLMGRRRFVHELKSNNWSMRQFGRRVAQNTPIQGTAADMIKRAMIDVERALAESRLQGRLLLQVHDELLLEVPEPELEETQALVIHRMEAAMTLDVPLVAEAGSGVTWYDCKS